MWCPRWNTVKALAARMWPRASPEFVVGNALRASRCANYRAECQWSFSEECGEYPGLRDCQIVTLNLYIPKPGLHERNIEHRSSSKTSGDYTLDILSI
jgi:hypothetical protein